MLNHFNLVKSSLYACVSFTRLIYKKELSTVDPNLFPVRFFQRLVGHVQESALKKKPHFKVVQNVRPSFR